MYSELERACSRPLWRPWEEGGLDGEKCSTAASLGLSLSFALPTQVFSPSPAMGSGSRPLSQPRPPRPPLAPSPLAARMPPVTASKATSDCEKLQVLAALAERHQMPPPERLRLKCEPESSPVPAPAVSDAQDRDTELNKAAARAAHLRAMKREPPLTIVTTGDELLTAPAASTASSSSTASTLPLPPTPQPPTSPTSAALGPYSATLSPLDCLFYWQPDEVRDQMRVLHFDAVDGFFALATVSELAVGNVYAFYAYIVLCSLFLSAVE